MSGYTGAMSSPPMCRFPKCGRNRGDGWFKRRLSKLRRRAWRNPDHPRGLAGLESRVNWKDW